MPVLRMFVRQEIPAHHPLIEGCGIRLLNADAQGRFLSLVELSIYGWVLLHDRSVAGIVVVENGTETFFPVSQARPDVVDAKTGRSNICGFAFVYPIQGDPEKVDIFVRASGQDVLLATAILKPQVSSKAVVGKNDFLFLGGADSNGLIEHITGKVAMTAAALDIHRRNFESFDRLKCPYVLTVVPEAHVVYAENLPDDIVVSGRRPIHALLKIFREKVFYPLDFLVEQKNSGVSVYTGNDSHWTEVAAHLTYAEIRKKLGRDVPTKASYEPTIFREVRDLCITDAAEAHNLALAAQNYAHGNWSPVFLAGILNHGNIASFRNENGTGRCLAFGTSFSTMLVSAYADDFRELVFCYGTAVDELMVEMVRPDFVIVEMPERFVHFPTLAVRGATFLSCMIASHERDYKCVAIDNIDQSPEPVSDALVVARDLIRSRTSSPYLESALATVAAYDQGVARRIGLVADLLRKISEPRVLRTIVAGQYNNSAYVLGALESMIEKGAIDEASCDIFPDSEMGLAARFKLMTGAGKTREAMSMLSAYVDAYGSTAFIASLGRTNP